MNVAVLGEIRATASAEQEASTAQSWHHPALWATRARLFR